jgi:hypothetical protein
MVVPIEFYGAALITDHGMPCMCVAHAVPLAIWS